MRKLVTGKLYEITSIHPESSWYKDSSIATGQQVRILGNLEDKELESYCPYLKYPQCAATVEFTSGANAGQTKTIIGFRAKIFHRTYTCGCGAYKFPHREGSGECEGSLDKPYICTQCDHRCSARVVKFMDGDIGGLQGPCLVSDCCQGFVDDAETGANATLDYSWQDHTDERY